MRSLEDQALGARARSPRWWARGSRSTDAAEAHAAIDTRATLGKTMLVP
jgi:hypothetical protein